MSSPNEGVAAPPPAVSARGDIPSPRADLEGGPLPEPGGFDAHTHMDIMGLPVDGVLAAASAAGIKRVVNVGCDLPSSRGAVSSAAAHPGVCAAVAIPPTETGAVSGEREPVLAAISALAESPKVVAIGETGL